MVNVILLTAAVTPDPRFGSAVSDPAERLMEYRKAVQQWQVDAAKAGLAVAVVETSGSVALADEAELISYTPTEDQVRRGKGAVEGAALEHALTFLSTERDATVVKVTGRLVVENAVRLLEPVAPNSARVRRTLDRKYCDSRFFATTAGFWADHLAGMGGDVDDAVGRYIEHSLAYRLIAAEFFDSSTVEPFPVRPLIVGQSGASGARYGTGVDRLKGPLLQAAEQVMLRLASKQV